MKQNSQTREVFDPVLEAATREFLQTVYLNLSFPVYYDVAERQTHPDERKPSEIGRVM